MSSSSHSQQCVPVVRHRAVGTGINFWSTTSGTVQHEAPATNPWANTLGNSKASMRLRRASFAEELSRRHAENQMDDGKQGVPPSSPSDDRSRLRFTEPPTPLGAPTEYRTRRHPTIGVGYGYAGYLSLVCTLSRVAASGRKGYPIFPCGAHMRGEPMGESLCGSPSIANARNRDRIVYYAHTPPQPNPKYVS